MKKSLSICAFSIIMLFASMDAFSQTRNRDRLRDEARARNGYHDNNRGSRGTVGRPTGAPNSTRVDRNRPNRGRVDRNNNNRHDRNNRNDRYDRSPRPRYTTPSTPRRHNPTYRPHRHTPYNHNYVERRRYLRSVNYARYLRDNRYNYFRNNWIFYPSTRINGYHVINNYPYFVFNGYQHRYSNYDICDYQLVDSVTNTVVRYYNNQACSYGYNECARDRNYYNDSAYSNRYFCAEAFQY